MSMKRLLAAALAVAFVTACGTTADRDPDAGMSPQQKRIWNSR